MGLDECDSGHVVTSEAVCKVIVDVVSVGHMCHFTYSSKQPSRLSRASYFYYSCYSSDLKLRSNIKQLYY